MRATILRILSFLISATAAAACDKSPTDVPLRPAQKQPEHLLVGAVTWKAVRLPFVPTAINDAGAIVGYQVLGPWDYQPVVWQNGTLGVLSVAGVYNNSAVPAAINANGVIAGFEWSGSVVWDNPTAQPTRSGPGNTGYWSIVAGVYNDGSFVGTVDDGWGYTHAFRTSSTLSVTTLPEGSAITAADGMGNGYGKASDGQLIRWSPTGAVTPLPIPLGAGGGGYITAGDGRGDLVGYAEGAGPAIWYANGTVSLLGSIPNVPRGLNGAGRLIGSETIGGVSRVWTSYKGALTVLAAPDSAGATAVAVNSCGSIIAQSGDGSAFPVYYGWLLMRSGLTPVCDQQLLISAARR